MTEAGMVQTLRLTDDRYLGYAWKAGKVHSMCIATSEAAAYTLTESSLRHKPIADQVYQNIEQMIRQMF